MITRGSRRPRRATNEEPRQPDQFDALLVRANEENYRAAEVERRRMHTAIFDYFRAHPLTTEELHEVETCANVAMNTVLSARGGEDHDRAAHEGSDFAQCGALYGFVLGLRRATATGRGA